LSVAVALTAMALLAMPGTGAVNTTVGGTVSPAWVTVNVCPAMVIVPMRAALLLVLGSTVYPTTALPAPLVPGQLALR